MDIKQLQMTLWSYFVLLLVIASCWKFTDGQPNTATVQLEWGSARPANNSAFRITAIGFSQSQFTGDPLACATQLIHCCHTLPGRYGHWFYPNGTEVPREGEGYGFYRYRRDSESGVLGGALLNRRSDAMGPTGIYRCVIPDAEGVNQTLYIGIYANTNDNGAQLDSINFAVASSSAQFVSFSLTCTSNRGPISTMRWEKDGTPIPGSSMYPDLTDPTMATYSNTLQVTGRQPGVYTCTATDGGNLLLSQNFTVEAANPPTSVSAALSTPSGSLIITWSPPATGGAEITGYRIYYNLGCLFMNVVVDETVNRYEMGLDGLLPEDIMSVSVRAESAQLPSELITVRIGAGNEALTTTTEELTMTTATAVTTAGMEATRRMTTSGMDGMGTAKMVTTNVNGMGTAPETDSNPVTTVTSDIVSTGPIGIVIDGLQPRTAKDDPLLIVAIVEGVIIAILIIILIVTTVLLLHYRNRVHDSMLRQTSQKIDPSSQNNLQSDCDAQSTEKLSSQLQVTDV